MPFDYQTLKNISSAAIIDGSVATADIGDTQITADRIQTGAVSSSKFAANAVNTTTGVVTGTLPVNRGGRGRTDLGSAYQAVYSDGSQQVNSDHGIYGIQVFTGSGTWNRPTNVRYIRVQCQGGAGGGSGHGEGGGAGGYTERFLDVTAFHQYLYMLVAVAVVLIILAQAEMATTQVLGHTARQVAVTEPIDRISTVAALVAQDRVEV